jgi:hypothetical protein
MYRVPADLDLSGVIGTDLNQICLGCGNVLLKFETATIAVESRVTVFEDGNVIATWIEGNWNSLEFQKLLSTTVVGYTVPDECTLEIQFSGKLKIHLHDDSVQYESMQIYLAADKNAPIII